MDLKFDSLNIRKFPLYLWLLFFIYSVLLASLFQNYIVPTFLNPGNQLLSGDAVLFDQVAWSMAERIKLHGWSEISLFSNSLETGNVVVAAIVYSIFGRDPSFIIPVNAILHATSGLMMFVLAFELTNQRKIGLVAGLMVSILFVVFPSALNWYGQLHKDGYAILGTLFIIYVWVKIFSRDFDFSLSLVIMSVLGIFLIGFVRPYALLLTFVVLVTSVTCVLLVQLCSKRITIDRKRSAFGVVFIVFLLASYLTISDSAVQVEKTIGDAGVNQVEDWSWQDTEWVPNKIERYVQGAATVRAILATSNVEQGAKSGIDLDVLPNDILGVIAYLPRATQIGMFSPFPSDWLDSLSLMRLVSIAEMLIYYSCAAGLFFLFVYNRSPSILFVAIFSVFFLSILGFSVVNVGSLYRVRCAYVFLIMMLGLIGWFIYLSRRQHVINLARYFSRLKENGSERLRLVFLSCSIMSITLLSFILFFFRDLYMATTYGLVGELDVFFLALMIPMTVVSIGCIPFGASFIPVFIELLRTKDESEVREYVKGLISVVLVVLAVVSMFVWYASVHLIPVISSAHTSMLDDFLLWGMVLLVVSGPVVIGNSILNAKGKVAFAGVSQLAVPVIALFILYFWGENNIKAGMIGMVVGQFVNLVLVQLYLSKFGFTLFPRMHWKALNFNNMFFSMQYYSLVSSSFFLALSVFVGSLLAVSLSEGAVTLLNLGNKVVLLMTGLVGSAITSVLLPHFSTIIAKGEMEKARQDLLFFMMLLILLVLPVSGILMSFPDFFVNMIFGVAELTADDLSDLSRIMVFSAIQLPFFTSLILMIRFLVAVKRVSIVLLVAFVGLVANILLSQILMPHLGVSGIALGGALSVVVATILLACFFVVHGYFSKSSFLMFVLISSACMLVFSSIIIHKFQGLLFVVFISCPLIIYFIKNSAMRADSNNVE